MGPPQAVLAKPLTLAGSAISLGRAGPIPAGFGPGEPQRAVKRTPPRPAEGRGGGGLRLEQSGFARGQQARFTHERLDDRAATGRDLSGP